jgi:hypothetical protein
MTDNTMGKSRGTTIYKTLHKNKQIEQQTHPLWPVNWCIQDPVANDITFNELSSHAEEKRNISTVVWTETYS